MLEEVSNEKVQTTTHWSEEYTQVIVTIDREKVSNDINALRPSPETHPIKVTQHWSLQLVIQLHHHTAKVTTLISRDILNLVGKKYVLIYVILLHKKCQVMQNWNFAVKYF